MNALLEAPARTPIGRAAQQPGSARILYVDDDAALRRLSTLTLTCTGYSVTPAQDGTQAWEALHSETYDLLITDNKTPPLTGSGLAARARLEGIKLPIIVTSGSADVLGSPDYECLDFAARLQRPFAPDELLETARQVLRPALSTRREKGILSVEIAEALRRITPYPHWGLNE